MEPVFENDSTDNLSAGKEIAPEAAFIAWSALETYTPTVKVAPIFGDPEDGDKYKLAASAAAARMPKNNSNAAPKEARIIFFDE